GIVRVFATRTFWISPLPIRYPSQRERQENVTGSGALLGFVLKHLLELLNGAGEQHADGAVALAQVSGDGLGRQVVNVAEPQGFAALLGKLGQGLGQAELFLIARQGLTWRRHARHEQVDESPRTV